MEIGEEFKTSSTMMDIIRNTDIYEQIFQFLYLHDINAVCQAWGLTKNYKNSNRSSVYIDLDYISDKFPLDKIIKKTTNHLHIEAKQNSIVNFTLPLYIQNLYILNGIYEINAPIYQYQDLQCIDMNHIDLDTVKPNVNHQKFVSMFNAFNNLTTLNITQCQFGSGIFTILMQCVGNQITNLHLERIHLENIEEINAISECCNNLHVVNFNTTIINPDVFIRILQNNRFIDTVNCNISSLTFTEESINAIIDNFPYNLKSLEFTTSRFIKDTVLQNLVHRCPNLEDVSLAGYHLIHTTVIGMVAHLRNLKKLKIKHSSDSSLSKKLQEYLTKNNRKLHIPQCY
jgi:hypothetical protein